MAIVAPSILSADFFQLGEQVLQAERGGAGLLHFDVMDGVFVPNISFGPAILQALLGRTSLRFDVHLMVREPDPLLAAFCSEQTDAIVVHQEACVHLHRVIAHIHQMGVSAGVALNPATPVGSLECVLGELDRVLVMGVDPGFGGQAFLPQTLHKIEQLCALRYEKDLSFQIEVDGGVSRENAKEIQRAGADILVAGSAIFHAPDIEREMRAFCEILGSEGKKA